MSSRFFLEPGDVAPENARRVLDVLNAATSARQIADAIEFPGQPDIGVRLAQRILDRRAQLGSFTDLQQIADIPLIGPERFTEIVTGLSAQRVPGRPLTPLEELQQEVATLRELLLRGGGIGVSARRLTLRAVQPYAFLGQPMTVVATLLDNDAPAVDVPITFVATRGELHANDGYAAHNGHLITARTGLDGTIRITLQASTSETLTSLQRDALTAMLARLDAAAATPRDIATQFEALARQYAWEVNVPFRQAVDIFVRDFQPMLLDTVNVRDYLAEWTFHDAALLAFVSSDGTNVEGSAVSASATLHARAKDWIPPFLETFITVWREQNTLTEELRTLGQTETDTGRLVTAVYDRAAAYVGTRFGRVGSYVGRKVAESSIRTFLDQELPNLPVDTRVAVFPALDVASKTLATTDAAVIRGLVGTRNDISREVDRKTAPAVDLGGLLDRVGELEFGLAAAPTRNEFESVRSELLAAVNVARTELTLALDQTSASLLNTLQQTTRDLDGVVAQLRTDLDLMQPRLDAAITQTELTAALAGRVTQTELSAALAGRVTQTELNAALANRVTDTQLNTALAGRVTQTELNAALANRVTDTQLNTALAGRVTQTQLDAALATRVTQTQLDTALQQKVDTTAFTSLSRDLDQRFVSVNTRLNRIG